MSDVNTDTGLGQHGGSPSWIARYYPSAPQPVIDLSTGINPYAYVPPAIDAAWPHRLPDHAEVQAAHEAAANYYDAPVQNVALAAGMQPLMFALAALRLKQSGPSRVSILAPTYGEHARVWQGMGHKIRHIAHLSETAADDVVILCNPNNPDGKQYSLEQLRPPPQGWLIVDESFTDLYPALSVAGSIHENRVVLRSCGKFFGMAGLRISAAIAPLAWAEFLRLSQGPWPLSTLACRMLPGMLADNSWIAQTRRQLEEESSLWRECLSQYFSLVGHTPLFTLVETDDVAGWHAHLASRGIAVRRFDDQPCRLRFGLPHQERLPRLRAALAARE